MILKHLYLLLFPLRLNHSQTRVLLLPFFKQGILHFKVSLLDLVQIKFVLGTLGCLLRLGERLIGVPKSRSNVLLGYAIFELRTAQTGVPA